MPSGLNFPFFFGIITLRSGSAEYPRLFNDAIALVFALGVFQVTLSTPGVFLPLFSVTRFTANALPLNEWVSNHCRAFAQGNRIKRPAFQALEPDSVHRIRP